MNKKHHEELTKALEKIQPSDWDKALERLAIVKLGVGDTYFHEQFNPDEVELMAQNIKDDFPILHETDVEKAIEKGIFDAGRIEELKRENKTLRDRLDEALAVNLAFQGAAGEFREKMARALIELASLPLRLEDDRPIDGEDVEGIFRMALSVFSETEIIAAKAEVGVPPTGEEMEKLRKALKSAG